MAVSINAGDLRQCVTLENPGGPAGDSDGMPILNYVAVLPSPWWAMIEAASVRASERHFASTVIANSTHIASGRFHPGITNQTRLTWTDRAGRVHQANVLAVDDTEGAGIETVVLMNEIAP